MATTPNPPSPASKPPQRKSAFIEIEKIKTELRKRRHKRKPTLRVAALNITSFLDMSFCLLMFLILSSGGGTAEGVFTSNLSKLGGEGGAAAVEVVVIKRPIFLTVSTRGEGRYTIEVDALSENFDNFDTLSKVLGKIRHDPKTNPSGVYEEDSPVIIRPRGDVPWYGVVSAFNAAVRARFKNVGFANAT